MGEISDFSTTAASNNSAAPNGAPEGMAPSGVNDVIRELMARLKRWYLDIGFTNTTAGSGNAYTLSASQIINAYAAGQVFAFVADRTNTGAATLNVDSVGAKAIKKQNDTDVSNGDIEAGQLVMVGFDASNDVFQMISPTAATSGVTGSGNNTWTGTNIFNGEAELKKPSLPSSTELTIASGSITPTQSHHTVDTEGDTNSDNLDTIVTSNFPDGGLLLLKNENTARQIYVRDKSISAGNINTQVYGTSFTLGGSNQKHVLFVRDGPEFWMISVPQALPGTDAATVAAGTTNGRAITPGTAQAHPSAAKAWAFFDLDGTIEDSFNVDSVTDNGTGEFTVVLGTDFGSASYVVVPHLLYSTPDNRFPFVYNQAAGSFDLRVGNEAGTVSETNVSKVMFVAYGTQ